MREMASQLLGPGLALSSTLLIVQSVSSLRFHRGSCNILLDKSVPLYLQGVKFQMTSLLLVKIVCC